MATHNVSNNTELSDAITNAMPGDIILVADGNYPARTLTRQIVGDYVTIRAVNPLGAVFDDITVSGGSFWRLDGVENASTSQIVLQNGAHHIEILNSKFNGSFINTVDDIRLENNDMGGHVTALNASRIDIVENDIHDTTNDALQVIGGSHNILIENNDVHDVIVASPSAHPDLIQMFQDFSTGATPSNVTIRGNHLYDDPVTGAIGSQGIFISDAGAGGYINIVVENNMITATLTNTLTIQGAASGCAFRNNTCTTGRIWIAENDGKTNTGLICEWNVAPSLLDDSVIGGGATVQNNLFYSGVHTHAELFDAYVDGSTWQQYVPLAGGPIDFGTLFGAWQRIQELQGGQPMPDTITVNDPVDSIVGTPPAPSATAVVNPDNTITIDAGDPDYVGEIAVGYTITDTESLTASATIFATFSGTAPTAADDFVSGPKGVPITLDPKLNDTAD